MPGSRIAILEDYRGAPSMRPMPRGRPAEHPAARRPMTRPFSRLSPAADVYMNPPRASYRPPEMRTWEPFPLPKGAKPKPKKGANTKMGRCAKKCKGKTAGKFKKCVRVCVKKRTKKRK